MFPVRSGYKSSLHVLTKKNAERQFIDKNVQKSGC